MMQRYKYSSKKKVLQSFAVICTLTITAGAIFQNYQLRSQIHDLTAGENISIGIEGNKTIVYVAKMHLPAGTILSEKYFSAIEVDSDTIQSQVLNIKDAEDKQLLVDLTVGKTLETSMLEEMDIPVENNKRYVEHTFLDGVVPLTLPPEQIDKSEVDIMLFKQGEPDKVVVERTTVIAAEGNKVGFQLTYEEMVKLKQAAAEGNLYLAFYLDKNQENDLSDDIKYQLPYLNN